jgi:outer membrane protein assembly factor BamD (BamD/ComL family)
MIAPAFALAVAVAIAPLQCGHSVDPALQRDETPGDALWRLARTFHDEHDDGASRRTLEYLVEQYPASRWAAAAREELDRGGGADAGGG